MKNAGYLESYRVVDDCLSVPIDGTELFRYSEIHCENCSVTRNPNGTVSYSHKVLTPVVAAPDNSKVIIDIKYKAVGSILSVRKTFFNDLEALTEYLFFSNWSQLINFMFKQLEIEPIATG